MSIPRYLPASVTLALLEHGPQAIAFAALESREWVWANPLFCRWLGVQRSALPAQLDPDVAAAIGVMPENGFPFTAVVPATSDRPEVTFLIHPFESESKRFLAISASIAGEGGQEAHSRDSLTGLADRGALDHRLNSLAATPSSQWPPLAILFIDLDGFKQINDQYGHLAGDLVITAVAKRIAEVVRTGDFLARYGGDEFVIVAEGLAPGDNLAPLVQRIRIAAEHPVETADGPLVLSASIGIAFSREGFATPRDMLAAADRRMYADKRQARGPID